MANLFQIIRIRPFRCSPRSAFARPTASSTAHATSAIPVRLKSPTKRHSTANISYNVVTPLPVRPFAPSPTLRTPQPDRHAGSSSDETTAATQLGCGRHRRHSSSSSAGSPRPPAAATASSSFGRTQRYTDADVLLRIDAVSGLMSTSVPNASSIPMPAASPQPLRQPLPTTGVSLHSSPPRRAATQIPIAHNTTTSNAATPLSTSAAQSIRTTRTSRLRAAALGTFYFSLGPSPFILKYVYLCELILFRLISPLLDKKTKSDSDSGASSSHPTQRGSPNNDLLHSTASHHPTASTSPTHHHHHHHRLSSGIPTLLLQPPSATTAVVTEQPLPRQPPQPSPLDDTWDFTSPRCRTSTMESAQRRRHTTVAVHVPVVDSYPLADVSSHQLADTPQPRSRTMVISKSNNRTTRSSTRTRITCTPHDVTFRLSITHMSQSLAVYTHTHTNQTVHITT